ncbi:MAG: cysteine synthase A [Kofleriaceae bacterium]|nr:cysteine synthase A [Kofleriaceae bacterium]
MTSPNTPSKRPGLLSLIGNTPILELKKIVPKGGAELWIKCEQYNPGGSVKDRIALAMIEEAEKNGKLTPGVSTIVEPTSGNTGIGLALVCTAKGYPLILTMPESMSLERRALLKSYGATLVLTPEAAVMQGAVDKAQELVDANAHYYMPDQFRNPANPRVHRETTAVEIMDQLQGKSIDAFVSAIGTGGTITGVGGAFRERWESCSVIGVEPASSAVLSGKPAGPHKIQGIGAGFIPEVLDLDGISEFRSVGDRDAYEMSKRLAQEEGLLVGISTGANVVIACQIAAELGPGKRVVTIACDTGERYFSLDEYFQ